MSDLLPQQSPLRVTQLAGRVSRAALARIDHLLVLLPQAPDAATWQQVPDGTRLRRELAGLGAGADAPALRSRLAAGPGVTLTRAPRAVATGSRSFQQLKCAADLVHEALGTRPRHLGILVAGFAPEAADHWTRALLLAAGAAAFRLPEFRRKPQAGPRLARVALLGLAQPLDLTRTLVEIEAGNLVRWLTALPPNRLTAGAYRELIAGLAEHEDWSLRFLDTAALKRLGAGAFLAVAQGNASADAGIVHLAWRPRGRRRPDLALVGKGIIFDTGGTNLKPFRAMLDMHQDMCGSAVALALLLAITRLKLPLAVDCWLAITENRIAPQAYKPRDLVTAADGTTIEVIHTDAEGRMALADTLVLACREKPGLVIDFATLTGQCINALTDRYSGVFSNREPLAGLVVAAGRASGERVWSFPMDEDFDEDLKSTVADVLQCSTESEGDHILAARFLQRFVPRAIPWIHLDLAAAARKKGLAQVPAGPTGFGVRLVLELLVEQAAALARHAAQPVHGD